jgi:hypothetical protein
MRLMSRALSWSVTGKKCGNVVGMAIIIIIVVITFITGVMPPQWRGEVPYQPRAYPMGNGYPTGGMSTKMFETLGPG